MIPSHSPTVFPPSPALKPYTLSSEQWRHIHTYIRTHTHIHTYIHTYIHAHTHISIWLLQEQFQLLIDNSYSKAPLVLANCELLRVLGFMV